MSRQERETHLLNEHGHAAAEGGPPPYPKNLIKDDSDDSLDWLHREDHRLPGYVKSHKHGRGK